MSFSISRIVRVPVYAAGEFSPVDVVSVVLQPVCVRDAAMS